MRKYKMIILTAAACLSLAACQPKDQGAQQTTQASEAESKTEAVAEVSLSNIHEAVKDAYGEGYIPSMTFDETMMEEIFGVKKDLYEEYIAEGPMISAHVDTFAAVHAKEGKGADVEAALKAYRDKQVNDSLQYPMNIAKVQASQVIRHGDYVFFVMLGTLDAGSEDQDEETALKLAKEANQIGIDIIDGFFK